MQMTRSMPSNYHLTGRFELIGGNKLAVFCEQLPIVGIGDTSQAAISNFLDCLNAYMRSAAETNTLDMVMQQHGAVLPIVANPPSEPRGWFSMSMPAMFETHDAPAPAD